MLVINIIDMLLFIVFLINILYLTIFSIASLFKNRMVVQKYTPQKKIAILIPAYKEDAVIRECVDSCLDQRYPSELYDIVVISDRMSEHTNESLSKLPIKLIKVYFENSTKSKALNFAMGELGDRYDIAVILDADNTISPDFMEQINNLFLSSDNVQIAQAHRCAKNINNPLALLDAVSEEINNSIFRKGHSNLEMSAALIGSGMCFDYDLFKSTMLKINAVGGFDRALELTLLRQGKRFYYMPYLDVLDEKVQRREDFSRQRRRWLSAQIHYLTRSMQFLPSAIREHRWDFCDKLFQQMTIPRVMLLGFCFIITVAMSIIDISLSIKWWALFGILIFTLMVAIPRKLYRKELFMAVIQIPYFFVLMALNLLRIKGANKTFIHTTHGVKK